MDAATRDLVWRRAQEHCEYCLIPQQATSVFTFHVEHIVARQHGGSDQTSNICLACNRCNAFKGPNLSSLDPDSRKVVPLFNPRKDAWDVHFELRGGEIVGLTAVGRATVQLLNMNAPHRVELREEWLKRT